ncbi:MAG TPA: hypothetical protein VK951_02195 [Miltoncostaeaceae bacterium]|nr:hypothetical protein [Miltoncostaeaceae bacterium]
MGLGATPQAEQTPAVLWHGTYEPKRATLEFAANLNRGGEGPLRLVRVAVKKRGGDEGYVIVRRCLVRCSPRALLSP